jgi:hypothetical protein
MDHHEYCPIVTVTDTKTGQTRQVETITLWEWTEGNWSCDCNRESFFGQQTDGRCTSTRYRVTSVEGMPEGYTLEDFNGDYDDLDQ